MMLFGPVESCLFLYLIMLRIKVCLLFGVTFVLCGRGGVMEVYCCSSSRAHSQIANLGYTIPLELLLVYAYVWMAYVLYYHYKNS